MPKVKIDSDKCKGCFLCVNFCPKSSLVVGDKFNRKGIKPAKVKEGAECVGCAMCAIVCPECCIEIYK
ncbi:MAG: 4Fe-4S dicluster domain-containing protein [Candidatus Omnitrophica bacterium]|nr:4Fe-4S dicluster domain-containing protein [Candidatus Omnitrophota bacterium]